MYLPENHTLVGAHFIDEERTIIETNWKDNDAEDVYRMYHIDVDTEQYEELLNLITIDEIHERTYRYIVDSRKAYEQSLLEVGKSSGELGDLNKIGDDEVCKFILETINRNDDELVFKLKLTMFEEDRVRASTNSELKTALRKATSLSEAFGLYAKF